MSFLSDLQPLVRHVTNEDVCLQLLHVFEPRHRVGSKAGYTDHPMISELVCRPPLAATIFVWGHMCGLLKLCDDLLFLILELLDHV